MSAEALKELGNEHYEQKRYNEAIASYTTIIDRLGGAEAPTIPLLRTVYANRAQCYICLEDYERAKNDCLHVLENYPFPASPNADERRIMRKIHECLGVSYSHLRMFDEALEQQRIVEEMRGTRAYRPIIVDPPPERQAPSNVATRPFRYEVKVLEGASPIASNRDTFIYTEQVPVHFCGRAGLAANPSEAAHFLNSLVRKHYREIWDSSPRWNCVACDKRATLMLHTPQGHLHEDPPFIFDMAHPICESGGRCETNSRQDTNDIMSLRANFGPRTA
ncbi:hypothetical protein CC1G_11093 [Coprinopsis cinerea okayama7|uniref:Uncharacterized protein n=1 Tax=Coprinopsis cinerea (strain Okayama-7 / 130 / ATCC MYA-4618 / FGSC 9003) TaxID=240176 RepID=A8P7M7_COPC7|nr:hypothetical protein CC1G_11093 [Coprinopsis cinerea okayama7\|eukprot:XP_001839393.2 hypothetical protein CC1G_11093 [Coprinopsis cinerea okayama7\